MLAGWRGAAGGGARADLRSWRRMARVLIIGGEDRGAALAAALVERGYAVRTVDLPEVPAGAERFHAEADRPGTLKAALAHVAVACWLFGSAPGGRARAETLNGARLERFLQQTIDSSVRGLLYEAAGSAGADVLAHGRALVSAFAEHNAVPLVTLACEPSARDAWIERALAGIASLVDRYA